MTSTRQAMWVGALTLSCGMALTSGATTASADDTDPTNPTSSASTTSGIGGGVGPVLNDSPPADGSSAAPDGNSPTAASSPGETDNDGPATKLGSDPTDSVATHVGVGDEPTASAPAATANVAEPTTTATEPTAPGAEAEPPAEATPAATEDSAPTPTVANDNDPSVGPSPRTADMSFQNPPREDRYSTGKWSFQVAPQDPGVTITATTTSGTMVQTGRFYMLSTGNPDGYNFTWAPANPGDTPQDVVFTATRPDGTTSIMTYRPASSGGGTTTPTTPQIPQTVTPTPTPTYPNLKPATNDPTPPPPPYDASDPTIGPNAANPSMQIVNSYWDANLKGWIVTVKPSSARLPVTASSPDGRMTESYPSGYRWVGEGPTEGQAFDYRFLFRPNDGLDWSNRYPTITFTAPDAAGAPSAITFRAPNPPDDGSEPLPTPDPNYFPPTGPNARNNEMQIRPTTGPNGSGWAIDVLQVPWVTVTAATPYGALTRWPGGDASTAEYLWTGNGDGRPPIVVLTAHFADGRSSTITYSPDAPAQPSGGSSTPTTRPTDQGSHTTLTDVGNDDLAVTETSSGAYTRMFDGSWMFRVEPRSPGVTITASTGTGAIEQSGRFYLPSTGNPDGYSFRWTPANPGDRPEDVIFTATRSDGTQSTVTYRP